MLLVKHVNTKLCIICESCASCIVVRMEVSARISKWAKIRGNESIAETFRRKIGDLWINKIWGRRTVPKGFSSKMRFALKMAFSSDLSVLKLFLAIITVIFPRRHLPAMTTTTRRIKKFWLLLVLGAWGYLYLLQWLLGSLFDDVAEEEEDTKAEVANSLSR